MSLSVFSRIIIISTTLVFSGCSSLFGDRGVFRGKSEDYLETGVLKPVVVPAGVKSKPLTPLYAIPSVAPEDEFGDSMALHEYEVPRPVAINTEKGGVGVKLQKLGENKWIFLNASTSQVWPRTQNFFSTYGIQVVSSNPVIGLIETGDVIFKDDESVKSRFRVYIEKGVHPETTEVHIVHVQLKANETLPTDFVWPNVSHNVKKEREILDELANVLAKNVNNNSASLLGQNVGGELKVEFLKTQQEPTMRLRLLKERARATVAHALEREGFKLWEESSAKGLYYIGFDPDGEDKGFFSRVLGRTLPSKAPYTIDKLLGHLADESDVKNKFSSIEGVSYGGEPLPKDLGFLVVMSGDDKTNDVVIRNVRGQRIDSEEAKYLLRIIRKNLI